MKTGLVNIIAIVKGECFGKNTNIVTLSSFLNAILYFKSSLKSMSKQIYTAFKTVFGGGTTTH